MFSRRILSSRTPTSKMTGAASLQLYVANGATGVRDMGADLDFILGLREATTLRRVLGPEIIAAGQSSMTHLETGPSECALRTRIKDARPFGS